MQAREGCECENDEERGGEGASPRGHIVDFYSLSIWLIVSQFLQSADLAGLNARN